MQANRELPLEKAAFNLLKGVVVVAGVFVCMMLTFADLLLFSVNNMLWLILFAVIYSVAPDEVIRNGAVFAGIGFLVARWIDWLPRLLSGEEASMIRFLDSLEDEKSSKPSFVHSIDPRSLLTNESLRDSLMQYNPRLNIYPNKRNILRRWFKQPDIEIVLTDPSHHYPITLSQKYWKQIKTTYRNWDLEINVRRVCITPKEISYLLDGEHQTTPPDAVRDLMVIVERNIRFETSNNQSWIIVELHDMELV